jgi:flagellar L-ring protein precursor FlgH
MKPAGWRRVGLRLTAVLICAAPVVARGQATPGRDAASARQTSPPQPNAAGAPATRLLVGSNGGSLFRSSVAAIPPAEQSSLESISFFHVPPPEPRTIVKHDLVTIIIREESQFKSDAKADMSREAAINARLQEFVRINLANWAIEGGGIGTPAPSIRANGSREFQGDGKIDRKDSFIARIQAEVLDVKPNGTLVLQARKRIRTDDEEQTIVLSGICRAEDVTADNSVLSTQLFDLELNKSTRGPVRDSTKRGVAHRFLDWLNPF